MFSTKACISPLLSFYSILMISCPAYTFNQYFLTHLFSTTDFLN